MSSVEWPADRPIPMAGDDQPQSIVREGRNILVNCEEVLGELDGLTGNRWHRHWLLSLVLIRMIGEVLHKREELCSDRHERSAQQEWWQTVKAAETHPEHIYWQFIAGNRNLALHEIRLEATAGTRIGTVGEDEVYQEMVAGPYHGRDTRVVYQEAIEWWRTQLDTIERRAAELREA